MSLREFQIIELFSQKQKFHRADVVLGMGDDCAITTVPANKRLAITVDTLVCGVHFPENTAPKDIAYKALAVNLSDLAAMGAEPAWITLALTLPNADTQWITDFSKGLFELLDPYSIQLIGGDLTRGPLTISIQAAGFLPENTALKRNGACIEDDIYVSGTLGDAGFALQGLKQNKKISAQFLSRLNRPTPRIELGILLQEFATSCIDISDGLSADLSHILQQSEVGAEIQLIDLPINKAIIDKLGEASAHTLALTAGDDYELCFTAPKKYRDKITDFEKTLSLKLTRIGKITQDKTLKLFDAKRQLITLSKLGYQHFSKED